jgi:branched-chain amino acid transport system substrate-binding protein
MDFQNRFGFEPLSYSENAYDSVYLMAYGMQKAQSLDPDAIKLVLQGLTNGTGTVVNVNEFAKGRQLIGADGSGSIRYEGASGSINWDANGDATSGTYEIWIIRGKAFQTITHVQVP